jgi:serine/threonine protein phosphatase PrpC
MNYIISASTDIGIRKETNQDSLFVRTLNVNQGKIVFAVLCDGMGGLSKGEVASAALINAFTLWMNNSFPALLSQKLDKNVIRIHWNSIVAEYNEKLINYGKLHNVNLGTTVVALLLTDDEYFVMNIGDSRAYEISDTLLQITDDQTLVAREIKQGLLTPEQAARDPRRNVLLQCVGVSNNVVPEYFFGTTKQNAVYLLCSDGFRHEISPQEIYSAFYPPNMIDSNILRQRELELIEINKQRNEEDNISVLTIRTF